MSPSCNCIGSVFLMCISSIMADDFDLTLLSLYPHGDWSQAAYFDALSFLGTLTEHPVIFRAAANV